MAVRKYQEIIDALSRSATVEDIHEACSKFCRLYDFDNFIYGARIPASFSKPYFIYISGYPKAWREIYNSEGYVRIDPTVHHCANHITPVTWERLSRQGKDDRRVREFFGEASQFGLVSGVSFPVHSGRGESAMLSLSSVESRQRAARKIEEAIPFGQMFTAYLHEAVRRVFSSEILPLTNVRLTEREKQCLLWCAEGKTTWETSRILGISERTVLYHIQNATEKLNVSNRSQAIARAIAMGLITPEFC